MQRACVLALAAALTLGATSAFAWSDVSGKISNVDSKAHRTVLNNGKTYTVERKMALDGLKPGDTVTLSTETKNGQNLVNQVTKDG